MLPAVRRYWVRHWAYNLSQETVPENVQWAWTGATQDSVTQRNCAKGHDNGPCRLLRSSQRATRILSVRVHSLSIVAQGSAPSSQDDVHGNRDELYGALWKDLRRNVIDADLMDVNYIVSEAKYALNHLDEWMKPERVHMPLMFEPGHVRVRHDPLGVTLIIGAWNEPYMLLFGPLAAALAGGNTAVLKPSELAVTCSAVTAKLVAKYFDTKAVAVVEGAVPETTDLLAQKWDFIFFTGSPGIGKIIHSEAWVTRGWASTTVDVGLRHSPMHAESCTTTPISIRMCATLRVRSTQSSVGWKRKYCINQLAEATPLCG